MLILANSEKTAAQEFHDATNLSYINLLTKPPLYKSYTGLSSIPLPQSDAPEMPTLEALARPATTGTAPLDLLSISQLLHYSAGLIRKSVSPSAGEVHYRAAASAGALYPIELYLVCGELDGLAAGVYHYSPAGHALTKLRTGDLRGNLAASADDETLASSPAIIISTAVFWRSAWKYRTRGYRYCFWDNGTMLANLLATASAVGQPARVIAGFIDFQVDLILGLDSREEASICLTAVGAPEEQPAAAAESMEVIDCGDLGFNDAIPYPESRRLHIEAALTSAQEVGRWRVETQVRETNVFGEIASAPLGESISCRGSTRRFAREPISYDQLSALLAASSVTMPTDFGGRLTEPYLIVNAVDGLVSGAYHYSRIKSELQLLREGEMRNEAGHLCFEQALGADASVVIFFLSDLNSVLERLGNRGYRAAQLEAGVLGGNLYMGAHSLGLGATGMTFFDDAVTAFFSPHSAGKSLMFLVGLGHSSSQNQVRPFRSKYGVLKDSLARGATGERRPVPEWLYSN